MSNQSKIPTIENSIRSATEVRPPALCPEIALHLMPAGMTLDGFRSRHESVFGLSTPYWAIAWPGGQALARFLLDNPDIVRGRRILDMGGGSGLAAIAAAHAGAAHSLALDRDATASKAALLNGDLNGVAIETKTAYAADVAMGSFDLILAGDLWYERFDGGRATSLLRRLARNGATVLLGDLERAYFPRKGVVQIAAFETTSDAALEQAEAVEVGVYRFESGEIGHAPNA